MEMNSNPCSYCSSSDSSTKMSANPSLKPYRSISKKSSRTVKKIMKHPIAPMPKIPPKIYKVEPNKFKEVVQKLTGPQPNGNRAVRRLKDLAPSPLDVSSAVEQAKVTLFCDGDDKEIIEQVQLDENIDGYLKNLETLIRKSPKLLTPSLASTSFGGFFSPFSSPAFTLSPASLEWCSLFLSPGTVSTLDQSILLGG